MAETHLNYFSAKITKQIILKSVLKSFSSLCIAFRKIFNEEYYENWICHVDFHFLNLVSASSVVRLTNNFFVIIFFSVFSKKSPIYICHRFNVLSIESLFSYRKLEYILFVDYMNRKVLFRFYDWYAFNPRMFSWVFNLHHCFKTLKTIRRKSNNFRGKYL